MPSNPIQRKTRNSFILGMLIMLLIVAVILIVLYFTVFAGKTGTGLGKGKTVEVYRVTSQIKSGEQIPLNKVEVVRLYAEDVPTDYAGAAVDVTLYKSKLDLQPGTVLCGSLLYEGEKLSNSTRLLEYNMLTLPSTLRIGDYIDVRFTLPNGQNFIVLSKKQVVNLQNTTVSMYLTEDEILMMSSAIIESYIMKASNLQAVQYVEAGIQEASTPTYSINEDVNRLVQSKRVNIEDLSKITGSYNEELRRIIGEELGQYIGEEITNIQEGIDKEKETSMELYLSGLQGY